MVDNASVDSTAALLARDHTGLRFVANPVNVGFAKAVNQALADVTADVVLLVNPDCIVPPATVRGLVEHLRSHPEVGIAGPRLVGPGGEAAISAHPFETPWQRPGLALRRQPAAGGHPAPARWSRPAAIGRGLPRHDPDSSRPCGWTGCPAPAWPYGVSCCASSAVWTSATSCTTRTRSSACRRGIAATEWNCFRSCEAEHSGGASSELGATWPHLYRSMLIFFFSHRRSSYQLVRLAVLVRALIGMGLAQVRRLFRRPGSWTRLRSWGEVASLTLAARREVPCVL